jgi:hypothetical protein
MLTAVQRFRFGHVFVQYCRIEINLPKSYSDFLEPPDDHELSSIYPSVFHLFNQIAIQIQPSV